jgi:hypothetical protein
VGDAEQGNVLIAAMDPMLPAAGQQLLQLINALPIPNTERKFIANNAKLQYHNNIINNKDNSFLVDLTAITQQIDTSDIYKLSHAFTRPFLHNSLGPGGKNIFDIIIPDCLLSIESICCELNCESADIDYWIPLINCNRGVEELNPISPSLWSQYFSKDIEYRAKILNSISLEISETKLAKKIRIPNFALRDDWLSYIWPGQLPPVLHEYVQSLNSNNVTLSPAAKKVNSRYPKCPNVQLFLLMSSALSFTDFHVDFGGSSVFYHVIKGEKLFFLIQPTDNNIAAYMRWYQSDPVKSQRSTLLDYLEPGAVELLHIKEGFTAFLPAGYIHAVFTPKDSIVIGGNYLTSHNISLQLSVASTERVLHTLPKLCFPYYRNINWLAAKYYCIELRKLQNEQRAQEIAPFSLIHSINMNVLNGLQSLVKSLRQFSAAEVIYAHIHAHNKNFKLPSSICFNHPATLLEELELRLIYQKYLFQKEEQKDNAEMQPYLHNSAIRAAESLSIADGYLGYNYPPIPSNFRVDDFRFEFGSYEGEAEEKLKKLLKAGKQEDNYEEIVLNQLPSIFNNYNTNRKFAQHLDEGLKIIYPELSPEEEENDLNNSERNLHTNIEENHSTAAAEEDKNDADAANFFISPAAENKYLAATDPNFVYYSDEVDVQNMLNRSTEPSREAEENDNYSEPSNYSDEEYKLDTGKLKRKLTSSKGNNKKKLAKTAVADGVIDKNNPAAIESMMLADIQAHKAKQSSAAGAASARARMMKKMGVKSKQLSRRF